jgi:hypothetical protein
MKLCSQNEWCFCVQSKSFQTCLAGREPTSESEQEVPQEYKRKETNPVLRSNPPMPGG